MAGVKNFTDLLIWQRARQWSKDIFLRAKQAPFCRDSRLVVQINDSTESVMANIAEGFGRGTQAEFVTFLGYAHASLNETQSHLVAAYDREYLTRAEYGKLFQEGNEIRSMMIGFINSMVLRGSGVKDRKKISPWSEDVWECYERLTGKQRPEFFRKQAEE